MTATTERAAEIRGWSRPTKPTRMGTLRRYSEVAAAWERLRVSLRRNPLPANDGRFLALTTALRVLADDLGLSTCTAETAGDHGVPGVTDPDGFLPGDPARLLGDDWLTAARFDVLGGTA